MSQSLKVLLFVILLSNICLCRVVYPQGLWAMNSFGDFSAQNEQVLSYFDFNRDRFVDIITRISSGSSYYLQLYLWSQQERKFITAAKVDMGMFKPVTCLVADLVKDDTMEIAITVENNIDQDHNWLYNILIYSLQCPNIVQCKIISNPQLPMPKSNSYPTILQLQNQNILIHSDRHKKLEYRKYIPKQPTQQQPNPSVYQQYDFVQNFFNDSSDQIKDRVCYLYQDLFFLDYNGDCLQDLVIWCKGELGMADLQFYRGDQNGKFRPEYRTSIGNANIKLLSVTIADINFDGLVDIIGLISTTSGELYLQLHYNTAIKQKYLKCKTTIQVQTKNYFPYHFVNSDAELDQDGVLMIQRYHLNFTYPEWSIQALTPNNFYLRTGDINNDGYMDIIVDGPNRVQLLLNLQCIDEFCGTYNPKFMEKWVLGKIRIFQSRKIDGLNNYNGKLCKMSFFDLYEDGRMDLISNLCPVDSLTKQNTGKLLAVYNALPMDAFFIKINILENLKNDTIKMENIFTKFNIYGAHADYFVTALTGERIPACGNQLSHPGRSLELPYIHSGLGRTNNYVEEITVSISGKDSVLMRTWSPIVPNSQLIVLPGKKWLLETYISPTAVMSILFWFVVLILILLAIWIARLTKKEKVQDKENQDSFYSILR